MEHLRIAPPHILGDVLSNCKGKSSVAVSYHLKEKGYDGFILLEWDSILLCVIDAVKGLRVYKDDLYVNGESVKDIKLTELEEKYSQKITTDYLEGKDYTEVNYHKEEDVIRTLGQAVAMAKIQPELKGSVSIHLVYDKGTKSRFKTLHSYSRLRTRIPSELLLEYIHLSKLVAKEYK